MGFLSAAFGAVTGARKAGRAAERAGQIQAGAAEAGIDEIRRQSQIAAELLSPYSTAGTSALTAQQALLGLQGPGAESEAIAAIEGSPIFQALIRQGENALLQNASATGDLRGGDIKGTLAQFRPNILSSLINERYNRLSGLSQLGQQTAFGQAGLGADTAGSIAELLEQRGAALSGGEIARGNIRRQTFNDILKLGSAVAGAF